MALTLSRDDLNLVVHSLRMSADEQYMNAARMWGWPRELELNADAERRRQLARRLELPLFEVAAP